MKDQLVPIDKAGRIVLPKTIRDELALNPGDLLTITVQGVSMTLVAARFSMEGESFGVHAGWVATFGNGVVGDILNETREDRSGEWDQPPRKVEGMRIFFDTKAQVPQIAFRGT